MLDSDYGSSMSCYNLCNLYKLLGGFLKSHFSSGCIMSSDATCSAQVLVNTFQYTLLPDLVGSLDDDL